MDIGLNSDFDLELDDRNDLPTVTGRDLFEQRLRISVTSFFQDVVGDTNRSSALQMVEVQARRIANRFSEIQRVVQIQVEYDDDEPNVINLTVIYDTGGEFTFSITE